MELDHKSFFMEVLGDQNRYLQILLNFLSNAIKFTGKNGRIVISTVLITSQPIKTQLEKTAEVEKNYKLEVLAAIKRESGINLEDLDNKS
jgi:signal transduction histidine kinase